MAGTLLHPDRVTLTLEDAWRDVPRMFENVVPSSDPTEGPDGHLARRVGNVLRHLGGEGTPGSLVDHTGTHRIHPEKARMILEAPAGVDIYPAGW